MAVDAIIKGAFHQENPRLFSYIQKRILRFFFKRYLGSWCVKGTEESALGKDSSVPRMHHDPRDLGWICLV